MAFPLPYTLCFIQHQDQVLLLERRFPPLAGLLNGVGGKLEPGETPRQGVIREVAEETGVCLTAPRFGGIVTWTGHDSGDKGMYVFVDRLPPGVDPARVAGETPEGTLRWESLADVLAGRVHVVSNIPCFLAPMLDGRPPVRHLLRYDGPHLLSHTTAPLPSDLTY